MSLHCYCFFLQIFVEAYDSNVTTNRAEVEVIINVIRNPNGPVFSPTSFYTVDIDELHALAVSVLNVSATDVENVNLLPTLCVLDNYVR